MYFKLPNIRVRTLYDIKIFRFILFISVDYLLLFSMAPEYCMLSLMYLIIAKNEKFWYVFFTLKLNIFH